jgi:RNA polymerase sigma-70 factor (ECF subfamily)
MTSRAAFDRELLEAWPALQAFARKLTQHDARGQDLAADTVEKALRHWESYQIGTKMKSWLFFICRNCFYSERRRAWRWQQPPVAAADPDVEMWDVLVQQPAGQLAKLELDDLLEALSYLPPALSDAILAISEGLSYEEAAEDIGVAVGTIKSRVSRGRAQLEAYFGLNLSREMT